MLDINNSTAVYIANILELTCISQVNQTAGLLKQNDTHLEMLFAQALLGDHVAIVDRFILSNVVEAKCPDAILAAAWNGNTKTVQAILSSAVSKPFDKTVILDACNIAARRGALSTAEFLIRHLFELGPFDVGGAITMLQSAVEGGNDKIVELLLRREEVYFMLGVQNRGTALALATRLGLLRIVHLLNGRAPGDLDSESLEAEQKAAALCSSLQDGPEMIREILKLGVDPFKAGTDFAPALFQSCRSGSLAAVKTLLNGDAGVNWNRSNVKCKYPHVPGNCSNDRI